MDQLDERAQAAAEEHAAILRRLAIVVSMLAGTA
jgi:hypothetical protein